MVIKIMEISFAYMQLEVNLLRKGGGENKKKRG